MHIYFWRCVPLVVFTVSGTRSYCCQTKATCSICCGFAVQIVVGLVENWGFVVDLLSFFCRPTDCYLGYIQAYSSNSTRSICCGFVVDLLYNLVVQQIHNKWSKWSLRLNLMHAFDAVASRLHSPLNRTGRTLTLERRRACDVTLVGWRNYCTKQLWTAAS
jgi:hypothetical protein